MCSYNSLNGVPTCGSKGLLTTVLRNTFQWDGFVVSDYDAWANIVDTHHFNATMEAGAAQGLNAGMDQEVLHRVVSSGPVQQDISSLLLKTKYAASSLFPPFPPSLALWPLAPETAGKVFAFKPVLWLSLAREAGATALCPSLPKGQPALRSAPLATRHS